MVDIDNYIVNINNNAKQKKKITETQQKDPSRLKTLAGSFPY